MSIKQKLVFGTAFIASAIAIAKGVKTNMDGAATAAAIDAANAQSFNACATEAVKINMPSGVTFGIEPQNGDLVGQRFECTDSPPGQAISNPYQCPDPKQDLVAYREYGPRVRTYAGEKSAEIIYENDGVKKHGADASSYTIKVQNYDLGGAQGSLTEYGNQVTNAEAGSVVRGAQRVLNSIKTCMAKRPAPTG